ncbi:hypothetical protein QYE76_067349 [Lolium multiflorum]|uniref:Uncharacterized protein n=1 Tax=Lolium multiflorum TaxID=4521 RepID=A0AAD8SCN3_LOLMU|nr:hypothetical protein QYE76_067349 [Lolium multiflorum]
MDADDLHNFLLDWDAAPSYSASARFRWREARRRMFTSFSSFFPDVYIPPIFFSSRLGEGGKHTTASPFPPIAALARSTPRRPFRCSLGVSLPPAALHGANNVVQVVTDNASNNMGAKVFEPLVKILRLADGDGQSMASMYGEIIEAKKAIMIAVENSEKDYMVITTAMESKMNGRLDTPLHMAGYALNPYYSYANTSIFSDVEVMSGLMEVVEQFYHDNDEAINKVDAKRRNKLDIRRRDDLVYIQFNGRMMDKRKKFKSSCDVLLGEDASMAQDWICEGAYKDEEVDPITGFHTPIVMMQEEEQVVVNEDEIEFESDDDGVLETKDNEDEEEPIES